MGVEAGKDAFFSLADSGDVVRTLTSYVTKISMALKGHALVDVTAMGASGHAWAPDELEDVTFTVDFLYDDGTNTVWATLNSLRNHTSATAFVIGPKGSTAGYPKVSGDCWLEDMPTEIAIGDVIRVPGVPFKVNGVATVGTF